MPSLRSVDPVGDFGLTWVVDDQMGRASHALRTDDGRVWFVDPVDVPSAVEQALELGEPAGVLQLLDRHPRDGDALASRFGVPLLRLPPFVARSPFSVFTVVDVPRWREVGLWWAARRVLVVPEAIGTVPYFRVGARLAGIHPFLRLTPPSAPRRFVPEHLLMGHGSALHGADAAEGMLEAYARSRRDLPRLPLAMLRA